jgi:hypothetical protein
MTNNKRKNFDIGDLVVVTHELNSTMYIVSGVKGNKLGVVDPIRALVVPETQALWLDAELFEVPLSFQLVRFQREHSRVERSILARNLGANLTA